MKFNELKQAMDWRRRVGFNGGGYVKKKVLPQPKPKEEAEKVNKARKEKTFKEAKPALENPKEVKEMIDKPKRGLVDEPGSYAGAADVRAFLKKAKKGSTVNVAKYLDEVAKTQAERNQLNADFKRIVKEFKNKNLKLKFGITGRKPKLEGKTGQIVEALQNLPKGSKINLLQLSDDLNLGDDGSSLIKKVIKSRKELQNKNFKAVTRTDTTIKKVNDFIEDYIKTNDQLPTQGEIKRGAKVDATVLRRLIDEGEVQRIANTAFQQNKLAAEYILNTNKPTLKGLEKIIGDTPIGASEKQGRNIPRSAESLASRVYVNSLRSLTNKLTGTDEGRSVYKNFSVKDVETIKNKIRQIPNFTSLYEREITDLVADAYKNNEAKKTKALKKIAQFKKINETLSKKFKFGQVLDHPLSYDFINKATQGADPEELIRVRPLPERVNSFKTFLDERVPIITEGLKKNPGSKQFISMRDDVVSIANELKIPFPKISNKGTIITPAAAKIGDKPIQEDVRKAGQIQNAFRNFVQRISNDPRIQRLDINIDKLKDLSKLPKVDLKAYDKAVTDFLEKSGKFGLMIGAPYIAARRGPEFLRELGIIDRDFEQTADVSMDKLPPEKPVSLGEKATFAGAAMLPFKKSRDFLLRRILPAAFSPTSLVGFGTESGAYDLTNPMGRVTAGAEAAFAPSIVKGTVSATQGIQNRNVRRLAQRALNLGLPAKLAMRAARVLNPIGLATLAGEGAFQLGKLGLEQRRRMQEMTPEQRQLFDAEQQGISEFAAAGGGIAKLAGKPSGPAPESGPTPQGLDFLLKRGR